MGNAIVFKEDGFTPILPGPDEYVKRVPLAAVDIAQSYVGRLASQPAVRNSKWANICIKETDEQGKYALHCGFYTLLPYHPERYNGVPDIYNEDRTNYIPQITEIKKWLSLTNEDVVWMKLGINDEYVVIINLN